MKARLPPPRSVAVTQVVAPAVPVVPEAVVRPVVVLVPVVARQAEAEPALVAAVALVLVAEAVVRPVVVQVAVVLPAVPVAERFPSEQWSKPVAAGWAVLRSSSPWPHLRLRSRCLRWRWLPLP
ncbi:hypothetical protein [Mycolicibacterium frederiksbergense]|uniref:hypothetical protein n=1 Tax=Mycolicibacterium frederiksbergense TaxID=117567 RepID=UPI00399A6CC4